MLIKESTYVRLLALAQHPKTGMDAPTMVRECMKRGVSCDSYAAQLQMQLTIIDALDSYRAEAKELGENILDTLKYASGSAASAIAGLTISEPIPGADVATMMANEAIYMFATMIGQCVNWVEPPAPPKRPTVDGNYTRN